MKDLVSIITPTYNCSRFIAETIESVLSQTYKNWEMIIVDDCSTDNTRNVVQQYSEKDDRIKFHCLKKNSGAAVARTYAMNIAKGNYMAFLDSDDVWLPNKLELQLDVMKEKQWNFTCTDYMHIDENGNNLNKVIKSIKKTNYNRLLLDCPVGNSTVMYSVDAMGKFKVPNIRKRNDDALWLQMLKKEKYIHGVNRVLTKYRIRSNSISSNKFELIKYHWILYRKIEELSIFQSIFHITYWCCIKMLHLK